MKPYATLLAFLAVATGATALSDTPVTKVLQLLAELQAKIIKDGEVEQKAYEEYVDWCQNGAKDKEWEIKTAKADIEELKATIAKAASDAENFAGKIEELAAAITTNEADLKSATEIRDKEREDFVAAETELVDAVDTLDRAISVLTKKMQGSALLQSKLRERLKHGNMQEVIRVLETVIDAASLNAHDKKTLLGLAQSDTGDDDEEEDDESDPGAPAPEAYKSKSGSIIDVLDDLKEKAENQLSALRKEEMNTKHNYEMLKQSLEDQVSADKKELSEAKAGKADALETGAQASGDLAGTEKDLATAQKVLGNMHNDCMTKAQDHETSVKSRGEELEALAQAQKLIKEMTGGAAEKTYGDFLQLRSSWNRFHGSISSSLKTRADLAGFEVVDLVKRLARKEHSEGLAQLASRIGSVMRYGAANGEDPFVKVKQLISDMIERLTKEGAAEADHKAYCDAELGKTKKKRRELEHDTETLSAKIDKAKTDSAKLKEEVAELSKEIAEITKSQAESDKIRVEEHAAYLETKADLEQGLQGIRQALKVLKEYYADEQSLLQGAQPDAPETHEKSQGGASGVIGMLEVIESDFSKGLAEAETEEDAAQVAYQKTLLTNKVSKTMKESDVKYKTKEAASLDKATSEMTQDLEGAQQELDALLKYTSNIRGMCELKPETYADRKARREAEIAGLREALSILDGEAVFLQRLKHGKPAARIGLRGVHAKLH